MENQKYLGIFDNPERQKGGGRIEDKVLIESVNEIYKYAERLKNTAKYIY
jgi:hypothetical protein